MLIKKSVYQLSLKGIWLLTNISSFRVWTFSGYRGEVGLKFFFFFTFTLLILALLIGDFKMTSFLAPYQ